MLPLNLTLITVAPVAPLLNAVLAELKKERALEVRVALYCLQEGEEDQIDRGLLQRDLAWADVVLLDLMGAPQGLTNYICSLLSGEKNLVLPTTFMSAELLQVTRWPPFSLQAVLEKGREMLPRMGAERGGPKKMEGEAPEAAMDPASLLAHFLPMLPPPLKEAGEHWLLGFNYWAGGGHENLKNLFLLLARELLAFPVERLEPPRPVPAAGIYRPDTGRNYPTLEAYLQDHPLDSSKDTVGIVFYLGRYGEASQAAVRGLLPKLAGLCNIIPVFFNTALVQKSRFLREYFYQDGLPLVQLVINLTAFRLDVGPRGGDPSQTVEELTKLNVPVLHPVPMNRREISDWEAAPSLSPVENIVQVILPEVDGCIEPIPISGLQKQGYDLQLGQALKGVAPIEERVKRVADRALRWLELQKKPNGQKKVAFILYNYPPGEDNLGGAAYLDVFASMEKIGEALAAAGYDLGDWPKGKLHTVLLQRGLVNTARWIPQELTGEHVLTLKAEVWGPLLEKLPGAQREALRQTWGPPPGKIMSGEDNVLLLPGFVSGKIFVGLQPSRGVQEEPEKSYHDKALPPHYQYVAFYRWLEEVFGADVCVHVGTHGTLEFLPGKEVGMSGSCYPDLLMGSMPHLYIYHVANPSEAMIAKRRSMATLVNYNSPPLTASELYEQLAELEQLIDEYHQARQQDPLRAEKVQRAILEKGATANFSATSVDELHGEIFRVKRSLIPKGLHVLDEAYTRDELIDFVAFVLRYDRGTIPSLNRLLCENAGINYDEALRNPAALHKGRPYAAWLEEREQQGWELLKTSFDHTIEEALLLFGFSGEEQAKMAEVLRYGHAVASRLRAGREIPALLQGLKGEFICPNLGGDPVRNPEVLPTGCNTYQFDPRQVPTEAAAARGAEIAENTLQHYYRLHGTYPRCTALVLWGFETAKTQGETVGQILHYLGLKAVREKGGWGARVAVIPLEELGRPRIDVVVNMCGFFRDLFPNVMELLDGAFQQVAALEEPAEMNYVRNNTQSLFKDLRSRMDNEEHARLLAAGRIFGPPTGEYGTSVNDLVKISNWTEESQLAAAYLQSMNHLYAGKLRARREDELYRRQLAAVEVVSQVRSSHDYEITDLDHYYEYFGGLAKAVEACSGKKPELLFSDTTAEVILTEDVAAAIRRSVRTRLLNPKWSENLLEHDYHGAQHIADRVENVLGLAATTNRVDNWIWSSIAARYVFDREMRRKLEKNNRWAAAELLRRLLEASRRGYWEADEKELAELQQAYLEIEGAIEEQL